MEKKNKNFVEKNKKQIVAIALALVLLLGGTYAWLTLTLHGTQKVRIEAGTLALELNEGDAINVADSLPMSDTDGLATTPYTFTLKNTGNVASEYTIYLDNGTISEGDTLMDDSIVKYSLTKTGADTKTALVSTLKSGEASERILDTGTIQPGEEYNLDYTLRLWIKDDATDSDVQVTSSDGTVVGKVFAGKLRIEASQIKE